jgi:hypothetical protein
MRMTRLFSLALACALVAGCFDSDEILGEESETSGELSHDIQCDARGICWVLQEGWPAWAQTLTDDQLEDALASGAFTPADYPLPETECYQIVGGTVHACLTEMDGHRVLGYPITDLGDKLVPSDCVDAGPWEYALERHAGPEPRCFGALNGLAILLDTSR